MPVLTQHESPDGEDEMRATCSSTEDATGYYDHEECVRYPLTHRIPPSQGVLRTNHQLRAEMQDMVEKSHLRYKIKLAFRNDKDTIYPTWLSVPAVSDHIDILDVEISMRRRKTTSLFSSLTGESEELEQEGDLVWSGLVLLQRFLERGVDFLSKKKARNTTIGLLALHVIPKGDEFYLASDELFEQLCGWAETLLLGVNSDDYIFDCKEQNRLDGFAHFFAERISQVSMTVDDRVKQWNVKECVAQRDLQHSLRREERQSEELLDGA